MLQYSNEWSKSNKISKLIKSKWKCNTDKYTRWQTIKLSIYIYESILSKRSLRSCVLTVFVIIIKSRIISIKFSNHSDDIARSDNEVIIFYQTVRQTVSENERTDMDKTVYTHKIDRIGHTYSFRGEVVKKTTIEITNCNFIS